MLTIADMQWVIDEARAALRKANDELDSLRAIATQPGLINELAHVNACLFKERQVKALENELCAARRQLADEISY
jgi:hypothetical protein